MQTMSGSLVNFSVCCFSSDTAEDILHLDTGNKKWCQRFYSQKQMYSIDGHRCKGQVWTSKSPNKMIIHVQLKRPGLQKYINCKCVCVCAMVKILPIPTKKDCYGKKNLNLQGLSKKIQLAWLTYGFTGVLKLPNYSGWQYFNFLVFTFFANFVPYFCSELNMNIFAKIHSWAENSTFF